MFRRRREDASPRPPASSAWWTPPDDMGADPNQAPPLPTSDPFGGWPAFPADGGRQRPVDDWGMPLPPGGQYPGPAYNGATGRAPGQPDNLAFPGHPSAGDPAGTERMPLLTHDEQSIQDEFARSGPMVEPSDDMLEAESWGAPPAPDRDTRRPRGDRGRVSRPRRPAQAAAPAMPLRHQAPMPTNQPPPLTSSSPTAQLATSQPSVGQPSVEQRSVTPADGQPHAATAQPADAPAQQPVGLGLTIMAEAMEAAALAGAFAADYLSWDESNPTRRGVVLMQYLPSDVVGDASLLGWSGRGRQRSEFALPGAVRPDGEGRLIVDVRVRITPYRAVGQSAEPASDPEDQMEVAGVPAVAPAPTARGWKSLDSYWVRLAVPVIRDQGRLVVDTWDEQLGDGQEDELDEDPTPSAEEPATAPAPVDITPGDALPTDTAPVDDAGSGETPPPRTKKATGRTRTSRTTAKTKAASQSASEDAR